MFAILYFFTQDRCALDSIWISSEIWNASADGLVVLDAAVGILRACARVHALLNGLVTPLARWAVSVDQALVRSAGDVRVALVVDRARAHGLVAPD